MDKQINKNKLLKHLKKNLPEHMVPFKIIQIEKLPLNKNQKTDRVELMSFLEK